MATPPDIRNPSATNVDRQVADGRALVRHARLRHPDAALSTWLATSFDANAFRRVAADFALDELGVGATAPVADPRVTAGDRAEPEE